MGDQRRHGLPYRSCYCEENVYKFLEAVAADEVEGLPASALDEFHAVFISNEAGVVPMLHQRAGSFEREDLPGIVLWDYHVVALRVGSPSRGAAVYDFDTALEPSWPTPAAAYARRAFAVGRDGSWRLSLHREDPSCRPRFRVVRAAYLLAHFSSDRSHMRAEGGGWLSPPPAWAPIRGGLAPTANELHAAYLEFREEPVRCLAPELRGVLDLGAFVAAFCAPPAAGRRAGREADAPPASPPPLPCGGGATGSFK